MYTDDDERAQAEREHLEDRRARQDEHAGDAVARATRGKPLDVDGFMDYAKYHPVGGWVTAHERALVRPDESRAARIMAPVVKAARDKVVTEAERQRKYYRAHAQRKKERNALK